MPKILKIIDGRARDPREFIETALGDLANNLGGVDELRKLLVRHRGVPEQALDIAFRHSRFESVLAAFGETLIAMSMHAGLLSALLSFQGVKFSVASVVVPTAIAFAVHVAVQIALAVAWCNRHLRTAFVRRSRPDAVRWAKAFYTDLARILSIPGMLLYPLTAAVSLWWAGGNLLTWCVELPVVLVAGLMVNSLYFMRLLHTDICEWFPVFSIELSDEEEAEIREARKGRGLHRWIWESLERRGAQQISPFEIYALVQCFFGLFAGIVVLAELLYIVDFVAEVCVTVAIGLGLLAVAYSYFRRFASLSRVSPDDTASWVASRKRVKEPHPPTICEYSGDDVDETSRVLRRAMP